MSKVRRDTFFRGVAAAVFAVLMLMAAAPADAVELPITTQRKHAARLQPKPLRVDPATPQHEGPVRTARFRFYADRDFRSSQLNWQDKMRAHLRRLGDYTEAAFGVRFEAESFHTWDRKAPSTDLSAMLAELHTLDDGASVDWVVGLVTPMAIISLEIDQLGMAGLASKHFVLRNLVSVKDGEVIERDLDLLKPEERAALYSARKAHRDKVLFLHEWGHTMGALHDEYQGWIMNPGYSQEMSTFAPANAEIIRLSLRHRLDEGYNRADEARDLLALIERTRKVNWRDADRSALTQRLQWFVKNGGSSATSGDPSATGPAAIDTVQPRLPAAALGIYKKASTQLAAKEPASARDTLKPLIGTYQDDLAVQTLACQLVPDADATTIAKTCSHVVDLANREKQFGPALTAATKLHTAGLREEAYAAIASANRLWAGNSNPQILSQLANLTVNLGGLSEAEAIITRVDDPTWVSQALEHATMVRRRVGLPAGHVVKNESEYVRAFGAASDALGGNQLDLARRLIKTGRKQYASPGFDVLTCELLIRKGQTKPAERVCRDAVARFDGLPRGHFWLGYLHYKQGGKGSLDVAVAHLEKAIALDTGTPAAWPLLGELYLAQGRKDALRALKLRHLELFEAPLHLR